jgi:hypothetical protein
VDLLALLGGHVCWVGGDGFAGAAGDLGDLGRLSGLCGGYGVSVGGVDLLGCYWTGRLGGSGGGADGAGLGGSAVWGLSVGVLGSLVMNLLVGIGLIIGFIWVS